MQSQVWTPVTVELDTENYSKFHENQPHDPHIITEEIVWSKKVSIVYFS